MITKTVKINTYKITKPLAVACQYFHSDANTKFICISIMLQGRLEYIKFIIGWIMTPNQYFSALQSMSNVNPIKIIAFKMMNYSFTTFVLKLCIYIQHVIHHRNYSCSFLMAWFSKFMFRWSSDLLIMSPQYMSKGSVRPHKSLNTEV